MKHKWILCLTIIALLTGILPAANLTLADGPDLASGMATGDDLLISLATGDKGAVALAYNDDDDEYLVVWGDMRGGATYYDIYGQFVSSAGVPRGDNFVIHHETSHFLWSPDVAYDTHNQRYLVVWEDLTEVDIEGIVLKSDGTAFSAPFDVADGVTLHPRVSPAVACYAHATQGIYNVVYSSGQSIDGNLQIYSRLVNVYGGTASGEFTICIQSGDQAYPDVAVDPATGHFLIVWKDSRGAVDRIYGRIQHATGSREDEFAIATPSEDVQYPAVAFSPDAGSAGEWLVVYERDVSGDDQIRGRRVAAAGVVTGSVIHICNASEDQVLPDVAYNAASGQYLVVWQDERAGNDDIYGRRVNTAGATAGDVFAICTASSDQTFPAVAASTSATAPGYLVAFDEEQNIGGQRVGTGGTLEDHEFIISAPLDDQEEPAVAYNSQDQEYLVVWQDRRAGNYDIYGQRVGLDGTLLGNNLAICTRTGGQFHPDLAYNLDTNQYLVVWEDRADNIDIRGQRVNANGSLDGAWFLISGSSSSARRRPRVTFNPISGEYFVVYVYEGGTNDIRARRVPASSIPSTGVIPVATGTADQNVPDVACRTREPGGGNYLVVWCERVDTQRDVRGQLVGQAGSLQGGVLDICVEAHSQWSPRVAYSPDVDHHLVVWPDDRNSATQGRNIYGRGVGAAGILKTELAICTAAGDQKHVAVAYSSGLRDWIVVWDDARNAATTPDIYAQRVNNDGTLAETTASVNDLLFEYSGWQQYPALAWSNTERQGLVAWQDGRNGESFLIYGLQLGAGDYTLYLPLVLCDY